MKIRVHDNLKKLKLLIGSVSKQLHQVRATNGRNTKHFHHCCSRKKRSSHTVPLLLQKKSSSQNVPLLFKWVADSCNAPHCTQWVFWHSNKIIDVVNINFAMCHCTHLHLHQGYCPCQNLVSTTAAFYSYYSLSLTLHHYSINNGYMSRNKKKVAHYYVRLEKK